MLAETQAFFPNTIVVNDFDHFRISKDKLVVADNLRHGKHKR